MRKPINRKRTIKHKSVISGELDTHKWATKMGIRRLIKNKLNLEIQKGPKKSD